MCYLHKEQVYKKKYSQGVAGGMSELSQILTGQNIINMKLKVQEVVTQLCCNLLKKIIINSFLDTQFNHKIFHFVVFSFLTKQ